ncbi:thioredoxin domain-containing protein [Novosphingobium sp. BL-52-GroH]|uniref:thioredoxin domain-containing protein n=1 Tax=Novosphingobium sp. BL-52-GroH TaxID=3349877 RepID=UPI00384FB28B
MRAPRMNAVLRLTLLATGIAAALAAGATPSLAATAPKKAAAPSGGASANWAGQIAVTADGSHRFGNPDAPVKLNEYVSYTCPHCAHFHKESDPVLRLTVVPKGQVSVTVTNFLRNPIDLTIAMLTNCGDPKRFFVRHNAFFATQDVWMAKIEKITRDQQARWYQGELTDRMRAISGDLGFYDKMESWGIGRAQVDVCLANKPMLDKLRAQQAEVEKLGFQGTPSFTLNGDVLDANDWASVSKAITAKLAEQRAGNI